MIRSNLFAPGIKFEVVDKTSDTTYGPGTTGYMAFVKGKDRDFVNVGFLSTIITRRGKSGKSRLHVAEISTPVFDVEHEGMVNILPDSKRKYFLRLNKVNQTYKDVFSMPEIDYLGWASAYAKYLNFICKLGGPGNTKFQLWPKDSHDILNRVLTLPEIYEDDTEAGFVLSGTDERNLFTSKARKIEASAVKNTLTYQLKLKCWEKDVMIYLHGKNINAEEFYKGINEAANSNDVLQKYIHAKSKKKALKKDDIDF